MTKNNGTGVWIWVCACNAAICVSGIAAAFVSPSWAAFFNIGFGLAGLIYSVVIIRMSRTLESIAMHAKAMSDTSGEIVKWAEQTMREQREREKQRDNATGIHGLEREDRRLH